MAEALGTASVNLTLNTADYDVAIARAKQQQAGLGAAAEAEATRMNRAQRNVVASLDRQIAKLGLTREQWLMYRTVTQTTGDTQAALLAKINANTAAVQRQGQARKQTGAQFNTYGLSAKMEAAALRQVPAQLPDIVGALQGGQN